MDRTSQASFIPKKPEGRAPSRGVNLILLVSVLIFFGSSSSAGFAFFYKGKLQESTETNRTALENQRKNNKTYLDSIRDLKRLNDRITQVQSLLGGHISVSSIFDLLEANVLKSIRLSSFEFSVLPGGGDGKSGGITATILGEAKGYESIAFQSKVFSGLSGIHEPVFSDLANSPKGVTFKMTAKVDPSTVNYGQTLSSSPSANVRDTNSESTENIPSLPITND
ncbi:MAG: hypothetical protein AAB545_02280 [Patescibacteria group bacterium]